MKAKLNNKLKAKLNPKKGIVAALLMAAFASLYWTKTGREIITFASLTDVAELVAYLQSLGYLGWVVGLLLVVLQNFLGFIPSVFLSGALVMVFGWVPGFLIAWVGEVIGAAAAFLLFRYFGRSKAALWLAKREKFAQWDAWTAQNAFLSILLVRLAPFVPSGAVNLAAALSSIGFVPFILGTAIGKAPTIIIETIIGHDMWNPVANAGRLGVALVSVGLLALLIKKYRKNLPSSND